MLLRLRQELREVLEIVLVDLEGDEGVIARWRSRRGQWGGGIHLGKEHIDVRAQLGRVRRLCVIVLLEQLHVVAQPVDQRQDEIGGDLLVRVGREIDRRLHAMAELLRHTKRKDAAFALERVNGPAHPGDALFRVFRLLGTEDLGFEVGERGLAAGDEQAEQLEIHGLWRRRLGSLLRRVRGIP